MITSTSPDIFANAQAASINDGDTAIAIVQGTAIINGSSAMALTLLPPRAGADDGKVLTILAATAFAHVVTATLLNYLYSKITFKGAGGNSVTLIAFQGGWLIQTFTSATDARCATLS